MRRFEEQYRLNEGDDVLNRENAIHQDVDLRLDAVELDAEAFRAGNRADIEAILKSLELTFGTLAAEMRGLLDQASGGLSADIIVETSARYFLTDARRGAILSDLRGGVDASGDTMAKLLALIAAVVGGAPVGRQSLKAINDAVVANTATLAAITNGADPTLDSFAEVLMRLIADEGQISAVMTALGNRLRLDAPGGYSEAYRGQGRANLLGAPATVSGNGTFAAADVGRKVRASGTITRTLPAISGVFAGWATGEIENTGPGLVTVAAGAGDAFEGVAGGSLALLPKQRAYFYLDADGWHVGWVERSPILQVIASGAAVASWDIALPVGYSTFAIICKGLVPVTNPTQLWARLSFDGGATFKSGASDYGYQYFTATGAGAPGAGVGNQSAAIITGSIGTGTNLGGLAEVRVDPGGNGLQAEVISRTFAINNASAFDGGLIGGRYNGTEGLRANALRLLWSTNVGVGAFTVRGVP